jgi:hypothetical protein
MAVPHPRPPRSRRRADPLQRRPRRQRRKAIRINEAGEFASFRHRIAVAFTAERVAYHDEIGGRRDRPHNAIDLIGSNRVALRRQRSHVRIVSGAPVFLCLQPDTQARPELQFCFIRASKQLGENQRLMRAARQRVGRSESRKSEIMIDPNAFGLALARLVSPVQGQWD